MASYLRFLLSGLWQHSNISDHQDILVFIKISDALIVKEENSAVRVAAVPDLSDHIHPVFIIIVLV